MNITIKKIVAFVALIIVGCVMFVYFGLQKINNKTSLNVGYTYSSEMESDLIKMTQLSLQTKDKNGNVVNDGKASDISLNYNSSNDTTKVEIKLNSKLKFSDGYKVTADDVIFSYYWLLDEKANADSSVANLPIIGLDEYKYNSSNIEEILVRARAELDKPTDSTKALISDNVIAAFLTSQLEWVRTLYGNSEYVDLTNRYPAAKDLFAYFYAPKEKYNSMSHDEAAVLAEVIAEYGYDYDSLGYAYSGDYDYFKQEALLQAIRTVGEYTDKGSEVSEVVGIKKTSDTSIEITVEGFDASYLNDISDIYVLPKHKYDNTSEVGSTIDCTIGAGMYIVSERTDSEVKLISNTKYYGKQPINTNVTLTCNYIPEDSYVLSYDTSAYCYVGLNSNNIKVNDDPLSQESCELRSDLLKAFKQEGSSNITLTPAQYSIYIYAGATGDHPAMDLINEAVTRLQAYGVVLTIIDVEDETVMWDAVNSGKAQMWCGVWNESSTPQFTQKYHSANINSLNASYNPYKLNSSELDSMIEDYNSCKDSTDLNKKNSQIKSKIEYYAIEQVLYNKKKTLYLSPAPKNAKKIFENMNKNTDWVNEIGNIIIVE